MERRTERQGKGWRMGEGRKHGCHLSVGSYSYSFYLGVSLEEAIMTQGKLVAAKGNSQQNLHVTEVF